MKIKKMKTNLLSALEVLKKWESLPRSEQTSSSARRHASLAGLKSILEVRTKAWLEEHSIPHSYETQRWVYQYAPQKYKPDFLVPNFVIECKGKMTREVRKKLLAIIKSNPDKKLHLVFERPQNKIDRGSKTTYAMWAEKHGIKWSDTVPLMKWFKKKRRTADAE